MPVAYEGIPTVKIVNASVTPRVYNEEEEMEKTRAWAKKQRESQKIHVELRGKNNDVLDPDPKRRLALEHTIPYEIKECPHCKTSVAYRSTDTIYSDVRGADKTILTKFSYPQYVGIDLEKSERDPYNNIQNVYGEYVPHRCRLDNFTKEELAKYVEHLNEQSLEFNRWVFQELRLMRKQFPTKPFYIDRD